MTSPSQPELERRALEFAKRGDFGDEALRVNAALTEHAPQDVSAWTRLGRCHLEQRNWDEATAAFRNALRLKPTHTVATSLLNEVRKRRSEAPPRAQSSTTGFTSREFGLLQSPPTGELRLALRTRVGSLLETLNSTHTASLIARARQDAGAHESTLFDTNIGDVDQPGRLVVYQRGGRFEPQLNLGWFSHPPLHANCLRIGLGFDFSGDADGDVAAGLEKALSFFERFQQALERSWKRELIQWMASDGAFIQHGDRPPSMDLLPAQAVDWLVNCRDAVRAEWIFVGRWLFLDNPEHARILADRGRLAKMMDDTLRALFPLWLQTYRDSSGDPHG
jgi:tetratricopeptide (TPR) repeat protein